MISGLQITFMFRLNSDGFIIVLNRKFVLTKAAVCIAPVVVGIGVLRVEPDGLVVVIDGPFELAKRLICFPPVFVGIGVLRVEPDGLVEVLYRTLVLT